MRGLPLVAAVLPAAGCGLPARDNGNDPAVRPNPRIEIAVDGLPSATGARGSLWRLDGLASEDPDGRAPQTLRRFEWSISAEPLPEPASAPGDAWIEIGGGDRSWAVVSSTNAAFASALASVTEFVKLEPSAPDGTGVAERWIRLVVQDRDGHRAASFAEIGVLNRPLVVNAGADRRVAPGGRWWVQSAAPSPITVEIEAVANDVDPGDAEGRAFTAENPARWRVTGELAASLDASPKDGWVDAAFVFDHGKRVAFPATIHPSRSELVVEAGDVIVSGQPSGIVRDAIRVDVLTSHWVYGSGNGRFERLDTSQVRSPWDVNGANEVFDDAVADKRILATDGSRLLLAWDAGTGIVYAIFDAGFHQVSSSTRSLGPGTIDEVSAVSDGSGGWWVMNSSTLAGGGFLAHLSSQEIEDARVDALPGEGTAARDFQAGTFGGLARAAGTTDVWAIGGESTTAGRRLFRIRTDETVVTATDAFPAAAAAKITSDGTGGVFVAAATGLSIRHVTSTGASNESVDGGCATSGTVAAIAYDLERDVLWASITGISPSRLCRRDSNWEWVGENVDTVDDVVVDPVDGTAVMPANSGAGLSRYEPFGAQSIAYASFAPPWRAIDLFRLEGGTLAATITDGVDRRFLIAEAGEIHSPTVLIPGILPYQFDEVDHAVDPVTGQLWVWRPDLGAVESYSPTGAPLRRHLLANTELRRGALAIDPDSRTLWLVWGGVYAGTLPPPEGRVLSMSIPPEDVSPLVVTSAAGVAVTVAWDLAVIPSGATAAGGRVCVAATRQGESQNDGAAFVLDASGTVVASAQTLTGSGTTPVNASADAMRGACWFVPDGNVDAVAGGPGLVMVSPAGQTRRDDYARRLRKPSFSRFGTANYQGWAPFVNGATQWLPYLNATGLTVSVTNPLAPKSDPGLPTVETNGAATIVHDQYYGHVLVGFGDANLAAGDGEVVRFYVHGNDVAESDRYGTFHWPRLASH